MVVFEEITGLSTKTIKDLISELERRDLIVRIRLRGGQLRIRIIKHIKDFALFAML
jgi:predicted transcriptional regulator